MNKKREFLNRYPGRYFLDPEDAAALTDFVRSRGWITAKETVRNIEKAGDGNMNLTLRVQTSQGGIILKQARPWVEKYPEIEAPVERTEVEAKFYRLISSVPELRRAMPALRGMESDSFLLALEDLGEAHDYTFLYQGGELELCEITRLADFLSLLHSCFTRETCDPIFSNRNMRRLNHRHIFEIPFQAENGIDLEAITPGLSQTALKVHRNRRLQRTTRWLGEIYLEDGPSLLHGDFFLGSWLKTENGPKVIDPEFCFFGRPEFDLGVFLAHFLIARQGLEQIKVLKSAYSGGCCVDWRLVEAFAGIEIIRRLLGVAQLPITMTLEQKSTLLEIAVWMVLSEETAKAHSAAFADK